MNKIKISPSLLAADFANMEKAVKMISSAEMVHCDIMDGNFVPNISFGPAMIAAIRPHTDALLDVHMMINNADQYVEEFVKAGADYIVVHAEACKHLDRVLSLIKSFGIKAGVALNPATSPDVLDYVYDKVDMILCMSVNPGFGGQSFIPGTLDKLRVISKKIAKCDHEILLQVDGGVNLDNYKSIIEAGATCLVAGSAVFRADNPAEVIEKLRG